MSRGDANDLRRLLLHWETDRRELALLQLTRVLFLYIVQSKGWLDGRDDFLRAGVDAALGARRSIHRRSSYAMARDHSGGR